MSRLPDRQGARPLRILFNTWANADNLNAQSLTAREIAKRLNPDRFRCALFLGAWQKPDPALSRLTHVRFVRVPRRLGSLRMAAELLWGRHDVLFYPSLNYRAARAYWFLKGLATSQTVIENVECSLDQILAFPAPLRDLAVSSIKGSDLVYAITPSIADSIHDTYGLTAEVMPLGVDLEVFMAADRCAHAPPLKVVYVASVQPRKQTHLILELARRMKADPVEFHIIGPPLIDPSYFERLVGEKEQEKLDKVIFHGPMLQQELAARLQQADVYVLPSRLEGFGKTTIEAAATGLPAIIFSDYNSTAVVDGVTGYQVDTFEQMHDRLQALLSDHGLRKRLADAAVVHARGFSWESIAAEWEKVFDNLAGTMGAGGYGTKDNVS